MFKKLKGFTLSEALITLVILGVIGAILIPSIKSENVKDKGFFTMAEKYQGYFAQTFINIILNNASLDDISRLKIDGEYFNITDSNVESKFSKIVKLYITDVGKAINTSDGYFGTKILKYDKTATDVDLNSYKAFYITSDGVLIGFKLYGNCTSSETITNPAENRVPYSVNNVCGSIFMDINSFTKPNKLGSDQYVLPFDLRGIKYTD